MAQTELDWNAVKLAGRKLGVADKAIEKWRSPERGIPAKWWLPIARELGVPAETVEAFTKSATA